jgi:site-specific recombinase XerD
MDKSLAITTDVRKLLVPADADKDTKYRIGKFADWLTANGRQWHDPALPVYRDYLLTLHSPATVAAHLSTLRANYLRLTHDNSIRQRLFDLAGESLRTMRQEDNPANRKAFVDERITRLQNAIDPKQSSVKVTKSQDKADGEHLRLTKEQANALLAAPGVIPLDALRDTAVIAMLLCTGIREAELCALDVKDLRQRLGGELAVHIREGKGAKERLVPYGDLSWVLAIVDKYLAAAGGITEGAVFRSFFRGGKVMRGRLSVRAVEDILAKYPVAVDGELKAVRPHDCRRTYARRLYEAGVDLVAIKQNLGHADLKTTLGYVGTLDADKRRAPGVYAFDLKKLNRVPTGGRGS